VTDVFSKNHANTEEQQKILSAYQIGVVKDDMDWHFEACLDKKQNVYPIFSKFLEKLHTNEQLQCYECIEDFKKNPTEDTARHIISMFIDADSPKEINLDHYVRQEILQKVRDSLPNPPSSIFNYVSDTLLLQLKSEVYNTFTSSVEFKLWISSRFQSDMMDTMNQFLMDFGQEEENISTHRTGCLCFA
jgi:hypothetical protein